MKSELTHIFTTLWYKTDDAHIRLTLYQLWAQPASRIASSLQRERTGVYKTLRQMASDGLISQTKKKNVTTFWIDTPARLFQALERHSQHIATLTAQQPDITTRLSQYDAHRYPHLPKISLYDGVDGITSLYADITHTTITNQYLVIKCFASNTFESQTSTTHTIKQYTADMFKQFKKHNISVETYLGNGILIMEQISKTTNIENLSNLPAWNSSINLFIVGKTLYLIVFKEIPFGIKIDSEEVANTLHFLFEHLEVG